MEEAKLAVVKKARRCRILMFGGLLLAGELLISRPSLDYSKTSKAIKAL